MRILFVGDVVSEIGRKTLQKSLPFVVKTYKCDFVIVNAENISNGRGINRSNYDFLCQLPINCLTLGNHYRDNVEVIDVIDHDNIIRPYNIKKAFPGKGTMIFNVKGKKIRVTNLLGVAYMKEKVNDPYLDLEELIKNDDSDIHIVDFHAEATGEKKAFAYSLKDKVTAVIGTHTHVQTADNQILNTGVAYISDVGMCGSYNSILGNEINSVVDKIVLHKEGVLFECLTNDDMLFNAVVIEVDDKTNKATSIERINLLNGKKNG
jgi:2',3'-cyclic-nucleotide 2'-phosphodiesterase